MRLRMIVQTLEEEGVGGAYISEAARALQDLGLSSDKIGPTWDAILAVTNERLDWAVLEKSPAVAMIYREVLDLIGSLAPEIRKVCALARFDCKYEHISLLTRRLAQRLPPNKFHEFDSKEVPTFAEVLNASWLALIEGLPAQKVTGEAHGTLPEYPSVERPLESPVGKLTLKALELIEVQTRFAQGGFQGTPLHYGLREGADEPKRVGVLTATDLKGRMLDTRSLQERLVVTPVLDERSSIREAAIDVRLGNQFILFRRESMLSLDVGREQSLEAPVGVRQDFVVNSFGEPLVLHPRQLVLGSTLEYIRLPEDLMCYVVGKSTWGRMGLIIATATKVDPGFAGCVTLEIVNEGDIPLVLYPGLPIAQLVFHTTSSPQAYQGRYTCPVGPEYPKFTGEWGFWTKRSGFD